MTSQPTDIARPGPIPTPIGQPFWDALADERVVIQRCGACDHWIHYPRARCVNCLSDDLTFVEVDPAARIHTFSVARTPVSEHFADEVPLVVAVVELPAADNVRLTTKLVDSREDELAVGAAVEPVFDHAPGRATLLHYTLV